MKESNLRVGCMVEGLPYSLPHHYILVPSDTCPSDRFLDNTTSYYFWHFVLWLLVAFPARSIDHHTPYHFFPQTTYPLLSFAVARGSQLNGRFPDDLLPPGLPIDYIRRPSSRSANPPPTPPPPPIRRQGHLPSSVDVFLHHTSSYYRPTTYVHLP